MLKINKVTLNSKSRTRMKHSKLHFPQSFRVSLYAGVLQTDIFRGVWQTGEGNPLLLLATQKWE